MYFADKLNPLRSTCRQDVRHYRLQSSRDPATFFGIVQLRALVETLEERCQQFSCTAVRDSLLYHIHGMTPLKSISPCVIALSTSSFLTYFKQPCGSSTFKDETLESVRVLWPTEDAVSLTTSAKLIVSLRCATWLRALRSKQNTSDSSEQCSIALSFE